MRVPARLAPVPVEVKLALTGLEERMLVSWATQSATDAPEVRWGTEPGQYQLSAPAAIRTYNASDLCQAPANSLGWKTPGALYSANLTGLQPATAYFYVVGSPAGGYSAETTFRTAPRPPAGDGDGATLQVPSVAGSGLGGPCAGRRRAPTQRRAHCVPSLRLPPLAAALQLLVVADMGQDNEDGALGWAYSVPSYDSDWEESMPAPGTLPAAVSEATWLGMGNQATEPDAMATIRALAREAATGSYNSLFHIGDISYARGMASQWDNYLQLVRCGVPARPLGKLWAVAAGC